MCLGLTNSRPLEGTIEEQYRALFEPILKKNMKKSWEQNWKKWFVTTDTVEEERFPGKLKCKFFSSFRFFVVSFFRFFNYNRFV